jgi:hypothetical protein
MRPLDVIARPYAPQISIFSRPAELRVPVCTFDGVVRTVEIDDPLVRAIFDAAFPAFSAGEGYYRNADIWGGRYRRYAGSSGSLDSRSYSTVARWNGHDDGVSIREIFAYSEPTETGIVMLDDMADPRDAATANRKYRTTLEPGPYLLLFVHEPERLIGNEWRELSSDDALPNLYRVPCGTRHIRLENVIDLRLPPVQAWFFETFSQEDWLNIHFPLPPAQSFLELLLVMLGQYRGGNLMTQAVGGELRLWGIGGLVYPSARCDCAVVVENDEVIDWYGWNLVDYDTTRKRKVGVDARDVGQSTLGTAEDIAHGTDLFGLPVGQIKVHHATEGKRRGTWQVRGLEALNADIWIRKLTPPQRQLLGLPVDADLVVRSPDGLDEIEQRLRTKYQALVESSGAQLINLQQMRQLLVRLANELARLPGGGTVGQPMMNVDDMAETLALGPLRDSFVQIGAATGILEHVGKYVGFADSKTLDYFTSIGSGAS